MISPVYRFDSIAAPPGPGTFMAIGFLCGILVCLIACALAQWAILRRLKEAGRLREEGAEMRRQAEKLLREITAIRRKA